MNLVYKKVGNYEGLKLWGATVEPECVLKAFKYAPFFCAWPSQTYLKVQPADLQFIDCLPAAAAAAAKSLQSCLTLCDPTDSSPLGSIVPGILQARTLEWFAISFSNAWEWKVKVKSLSRVRLLATPWTAAYQAPPSMGFSRQEYWSGAPLPSALAGRLSTTEPPRKPI